MKGRTPPTCTTIRTSGARKRQLLPYALGSCEAAATKGSHLYVEADMNFVIMIFKVVSLEYRICAILALKRWLLMPGSKLLYDVRSWSL